jgi:hypothetical protein
MEETQALLNKIQEECNAVFDRHKEDPPVVVEEKQLAKETIRKQPSHSSEQSKTELDRALDETEALVRSLVDLPL